MTNTIAMMNGSSLSDDAAAAAGDDSYYSFPTLSPPPSIAEAFDHLPRSLEGLFANKFNANDRVDDPRFFVDIPCVGLFGVSGFNPMFWVQSFVLVFLQTAMNVLVALVVYRYIVLKQPRQRRPLPKKQVPPPPQAVAVQAESFHARNGKMLLRSGTSSTVRMSSFDSSDSNDNSSKSSSGDSSSSTDGDKHRTMTTAMKPCTSSFLLGYGVICPLLFYLPWITIRVLDLRNIALILCMAGAAPSLLVLRCVEAMHGTLPGFAYESKTNFVLYYATALGFQFGFDPETSRVVPFSKREFVQRAAKFLRLFVESTVAYSVLLPCGFTLFPRKEIITILDPLYYGNMLNNFGTLLLLRVDNDRMEQRAPLIRWHASPHLFFSRI